MDMDLIVKWSSILSPLIAVIIAVWSGISSRKATAKQLSAIKESTTKQVDSIKKLAKIQIELTKIQLKSELWDAENKLDQKMDEGKYAIERQDSMFGVPMNEFTNRRNEEMEKEDRRLAEQTYLTKRKAVLAMYVESLKAIEFELNKE